MSFEYLADASSGPAWKGLLPGRPEPYFLKRGAGEHAMLFADLFTVLLTGDETEGQFGVFTSQAPRGQLIPAHAHHRTHEVLYIVEGGVRVYIQDRDGAKLVWERLRHKFSRLRCIWPMAAMRDSS